jgi:hypothetical protein
VLPGFVYHCTSVPDTQQASGECLLSEQIDKEVWLSLIFCEMGHIDLLTGEMWLR